MKTKKWFIEIKSKGVKFKCASISLRNAILNFYKENFPEIALTYYKK